MTSIGDPSSAEVERDAEQERAGLVNTLDQLRENLRPANMVDEVMATAKVNVADISDRVWQTARNNPIPAVLIGLGAAMIMGVGSRVRSKVAGKDEDWMDARRFPVGIDDSPRQGDDSYPLDASLVPQRYGTSLATPATPYLNAGDSQMASVRDKLSAQLDRVGSRASDAASRISDSVGDLRRQANNAIGATTSSAREGLGSASGDTMNQYSRSRDQVTSSISKLLDEQPLVLAALGIAVGAAIGAAIPTTETEGQWMGETSGSVKKAAQDAVQEQYAQLKTTAGQTFDEIKKSATEHGVSPDNLSDLVHDVGGKVRDAAHGVGDQVANAVPTKS